MNLESDFYMFLKKRYWKSSWDHYNYCIFNCLYFVSIFLSLHSFTEHNQIIFYHEKNYFSLIIPCGSNVCICTKYSKPVWL